MGVDMGFTAKSKLTVRTLATTVLLLIAVISISGCGMSKTRTETNFECYDWAGNLLNNCTATIYDHSDNARIDEYFHDEKVGGVYINQKYDEWVEAGKPESEVSYRYYCAYTENGNDHALLYVNAETHCWDYTVKDGSGKAAGSVYFDANGAAYKVNTVTGDYNSNNQKERLARLNYDYFEKAAQVIASLDPDYLPDLDPSSSVKANQLALAEKADKDESRANENVVTWSDARLHIGESVTISGPVVDANYMPDSNGSPTFIDLGEGYPSTNRTSIVIWGEDRGNFSIAPEDMYSEGTLYVIGVPYERNGSVYVKVTSPEQIMLG